MASRPRLLRLLVVGVAMVVLVLSLAEHRRFTSEKQALVLLLERPELREVAYVLEEIVRRATALDEELRRATDLDRARTIAARQLVFTELAAGPDVAGSPESIARLELARELAAGALYRRPALAPAAAALGAAEYLLLRRRQDRRLFTESQRWERPLLLARGLGRSGDDGARFLAVSYLELWPALSAEKRAEAKEVLRDAFGDHELLQRLAPAWLEAAADLEEVLSVVPDRSDAWRVLASAYAGRGAWDEYLAVRQRYVEALGTELATKMDEAWRWRLRGDLHKAQELYLASLSRLPVGGELELARRLFSEIPTGAVSRQRYQVVVAAWVDWVLERCLLGKCPFPEQVIERMADLIPEPDAERRALARAVLGSEGPGAISANGEDAAEPEGLVLVAEALRLARSGETGEARAALDRLAEGAPCHAVCRVAELRVARLLEDAERSATAAARVRTLAQSRWGRGEWNGDRRSAEVAMVVASEAPGLVVQLGAAEPGAAVEVRLDGTLQGVFVVRGRTPIELEGPIAAGFHRLRVSTLDGARVLRGEVYLREPRRTEAAVREPSSTAAVKALAGIVSPKSRLS